MRFCLFFLMLIFAVAQNAKAEDSFSKAQADFYSSNASDAITTLSSLCDSGDDRACSLLGFGYYSGRFGFTQNIEKSIDWYKKCDQKQNGISCKKELGKIYYLQRQYKNAFDLYMGLARRNFPDARYWTGRLYLEGKGTASDYSKALYWLRLAAHARKNPSKEARCKLLEMSYFATGMKQNMKDVNYWLKLCDNPQVQALKYFFGHSVKKNKAKAKEIMTENHLTEMLSDWNDLNGNPKHSVDKKITRDNYQLQSCLSLPQNITKNKKDIQSYVVKIFNKKFYKTFDVFDGYIKNAGIGDETFEACGKTFYTNTEEKKLFLKSLRHQDLIKISKYTNPCTSAEIVGLCDLNFKWEEVK